MTGILVSLLLGAGVFYLLYTALGSPTQPPGEVLGAAATSIAPPPATPLPTLEPPPATELPRVEDTFMPPSEPTAEPTPTATPVPTETPEPTSLPTRTATASPTATPLIYLHVNSNGSTLNIRRQPGPDSELVVRVEDDARLLDLGETERIDGDLWRRVQTEGGEVGWAADQFLEEE